MSADAWNMLGILLIMFALLIWDRFPAWIVFMGTITVAMTIGLADEQDLLNGFSNTGVITVAALFPVRGRHVCNWCDHVAGQQGDRSAQEPT